MVWELFCEEFELHADICNMGSGFMATEYTSIHQIPGTEGQNKRPNWLSHILQTCATCRQCYL